LKPYSGEYIIELYPNFTSQLSHTRELTTLYTYSHPRPAVTVDIAIFMPKDDNFSILLIQRAAEPFQGLYALPGGFMAIDETLESAAFRELKEETGLHVPHLAQVHTFSALDRDPRGRVISTCFAALIDERKPIQPTAGSDAAQLAWFKLDSLPPLAFDHEQVISAVADRFLSPGNPDLL
jgi:8-oxo-dGTP diphosphatase